MRRKSVDSERIASHSLLPDLWPATPDLSEHHGLLCSPCLAGWPNPASLQLDRGIGLQSEAFCGAWLSAAPSDGDHSFLVPEKVFPAKHT